MDPVDPIFLQGAWRESIPGSPRIERTQPEQRDQPHEQPARRRPPGGGAEPDDTEDYEDDYEPSGEQPDASAEDAFGDGQRPLEPPDDDSVIVDLMHGNADPDRDDDGGTGHIDISV